MTASRCCGRALTLSFEGAVVCSWCLAPSKSRIERWYPAQVRKAKRRAALAQMFLADPTCTYCGIQTDLVVVDRQRRRCEATVDHLLPRSKGGTFARENLVLACRGCNMRRGDRRVIDFLRGRR